MPSAAAMEIVQQELAHIIDSEYVIITKNFKFLATLKDCMHERLQEDKRPCIFRGALLLKSEIKHILSNNRRLKHILKHKKYILSGLIVKKFVDRLNLHIESDYLNSKYDTLANLILTYFKIKPEYLSSAYFYIRRALYNSDENITAYYLFKYCRHAFADQNKREYIKNTEPLTDVVIYDLAHPIVDRYKRDNKFLKIYLKELYSKLPDRARFICDQIYLGYTFEEIGQMLNITRQAVHAYFRDELKRRIGYEISKTLTLW